MTSRQCIFADNGLSITTPIKRDRPPTSSCARLRAVDSSSRPLVWRLSAGDKGAGQQGSVTPTSRLIGSYRTPSARPEQPCETARANRALAHFSAIEGER